MCVTAMPIYGHAGPFIKHLDMTHKNIGIGFLAKNA